MDCVQIILFFYFSWCPSLPSNEKIKIVEQRHENPENIKYVRVTAVDKKKKKNKFTRIFKLSSNNTLEIGKIANENKTFNLKSSGTYYNPIVPKGFAPINVGDAIWGSADGWNNGLVIKDDNGNEFVWIPVESSNDTEFNSKFVTYPWNLSEDEFSKYKETQSDELNLMKESVRKNGGFYIARYEAGLPSGADRTKVDGSILPVSKGDNTVWNILDIESAKKLSRAMYVNTSKISEYDLPSNLSNNTGVISTLIYGTQWDLALNFIGKNYPEYIQNSYEYGNIGTETLNKTGVNSKYCQKNIYDMSGNYEEITMEQYSDSNVVVTRGNSAYTSKNDSLVSSRNQISSNLALTYSFRVALYINN